MSIQRSTVQRLEHEIVYLEYNKIPIRSTGELVNDLDFCFTLESGSPKLTDESIEKIAKALLSNDKFSGALNL